MSAIIVERAGLRGDLAELMGQGTWSDEAVAAAGLAILDSPFVTIGGGLGSFAVVDFLRVAGVGRDQIRVLAPFESPSASYRFLCESSDLMAEDSLRSDSMSRIDNIWGWPSYAMQDALKRRTIGPLLRVLAEPVLAEFYNPPPRLVYAGLEREATRIGWSDLLARGQVRVVRRRQTGGYFALLDPPATVAAAPVAYRARHVHVAVGYPSLRFLPALRSYRQRFGEQHRFVNAYEPHGHVHRSLIAAPGTVVVRGAGITASRILQRLIDDRDRCGAQTTIVQLLRRYREGPLVFGRDGGHGFTYQPFTFPKAAGGGQLRRRLLSLEGQQRAELIRSIGGTTTAKRKSWQAQLGRGRRQGWYRTQVGELDEVIPAPDDDKLLAIGHCPDGTGFCLNADFVIDATGLEGDVTEHPLLADLLECSGAGLNPLGRLDVDPHFEVRGTRSGPGRLFASGPITLGGYLAPVDSFWGLEHAAVEICDELARQGFGSRIGTRASIRGWWRWARNREI